ncbi:MAG: hypothetical protein ACREHD_27780, partial [Pirellulales bacterium]
MSTAAQTIAIAAALLAGGLWLQLPRGTARGRWWGIVLAAIGVGMLGALVVRFHAEHWIGEAVFFSVAVTTIV